MKKYFLLLLMCIMLVTGIVAISHNNKEKILEETGSMERSSSEEFWLNSGAYIYQKGTLMWSIQNKIPEENSRWRNAYLKSNAVDSDNGNHPQNILRLITRKKWENFQQQVYFKINKDNLSNSSRRTGSNGLLLFTHYEDSDNLYYAGIRVDGDAVIKKKMNGIYYTLNEKKIFEGNYDRTNNPNLLPKNTWIGIKTETINNPDGTVTIRLYMDKGKIGYWVLLLEATDQETIGGNSIKDGYAGIRTDFMDVEFDNYKFKEINSDI